MATTETNEQQLLVKVCGMRNPENMANLAAVDIDFMGFIFYPKSQRYVTPELLAPEIVHSISHKAKTVGVFVNEDADKLLQIAKEYKLDYLQLHGSESPEYCKQIQSQGFGIIKAFGINADFDFGKLKPYLPYVNYFLFDTQSKSHGGTGRKFNWAWINNYKLNKPFLLSGGIGHNDSKAISQLAHPMLVGIDLNSKFESQPAHKNIALLQEFISRMRTNTNL